MYSQPVTITFTAHRIRLLFYTFRGLLYIVFTFSGALVGQAVRVTDSLCFSQPPTSFLEPSLYSVKVINKPNTKSKSSYIPGG